MDWNLSRGPSRNKVWAVGVSGESGCATLPQFIEREKAWRVESRSSKNTLSELVLFWAAVENLMPEKSRRRDKLTHWRGAMLNGLAKTSDSAQAFSCCLIRKTSQLSSFSAFQHSCRTTFLQNDSTPNQRINPHLNDRSSELEFIEQRWDRDWLVKADKQINDYTETNRQLVR